MATRAKDQSSSYDEKLGEATKPVQTEDKPVRHGDMVFIYLPKAHKARLQRHWKERGLSLSAGCRSVIMDWMIANNV